MDISKFDSIKTNVKKLELEDPNGDPLLYDTGTMIASTTEFEDSAAEFEEDGETPRKVPVMVPVMARVTISLVSSDSPEYTRAYKAQVTNTVQRVSKRGSKKHNVTGESVAEDKLELLIACTKAWVGWSDKGIEFPFNTKNVRALYERLPFVRDQVDEFVHDRGNF